MPSAFTHAAAALAIGACWYRRDVPGRVWATGAACAVLPDADALGFWAGVPYDSFWGHRGFTHSLLCAALIGGTATLVLRRAGPTGLPPAALFLYLFLATASHGVLDAFTSGGGGIALLAPFDATRYFAPFRPIRVAPISITRFFTARGARVFGSELQWVWLPAAIFAAGVLALRRPAAGPPRP